MPAYYSDASVAVVSSAWPEPFGAVGLEAMRYGLPLVAFDAGGVKEWLMDGVSGFLVPHMDRAQFAARIEHLLRDKSLARQMGAPVRTGEIQFRPIYYRIGSHVRACHRRERNAE